MMLRFTRSALFGDIRWRLIYLACGMVTFVLSFYAAANTYMDGDQAKTIVQEMQTKNEGIDQIGIFINNILIILAMFIPAVGVGLGIYSGISTGMVISALSSLSLLPEGFSALSVLLTPFGIMEIVAYGIGISRSGILTYNLVKKKKSWKKDYVFPTLIEMAIVTAILLIASIFESLTMG